MSMRKPVCMLDNTDITELVAKDGIDFTAETIWSENTGRSTSTGTMVGDIITVKYTVRVKFKKLNAEQFRSIWKLISTAQAFHALQFPLPSDAVGAYDSKKITCYIAPPTASMAAWYKHGSEGWFEGLEIECIEK